MTQSKYFPSPYGSDASLAFLLLSNQSLYPGSDCEATMLQEALAVTNDPPAEKKPNYVLTIGLEALVTLLLIGMGLLVQFSNKTDIAITSLELQEAENIHQKYQA